MMYSNSEKRKFKRLKVKFPVLFTVKNPTLVKMMFKGRKFKARTKDLCEGGVTLQTGFYLPVKTVLNIKFITHDISHEKDKMTQKEISILGKIVSVAPIKDRNYLLGISFGPVNEEKLGKFFDLICCPEIHS